MNISNFLKNAIEKSNHNNLALLWIDITKSNIKCVDYENFLFQTVLPWKNNVNINQVIESKAKILNIIISDSNLYFI
jgi:hypothetical protein